MLPNERIFHNGWSGVMRVWREGGGGREARRLIERKGEQEVVDDCLLLLGI